MIHCVYFFTSPKNSHVLTGDESLRFKNESLRVEFQMSGGISQSISIVSKAKYALFTLRVRDRTYRTDLIQLPPKGLISMFNRGVGGTLKLW
jgi:hypothetical protein